MRKRRKKMRGAIRDEPLRYDLRFIARGLVPRKTIGSFVVGGYDRAL
jgi:hypothetical protein